MFRRILPLALLSFLAWGCQPGLVIDSVEFIRHSKEKGLAYTFTIKNVGRESIEIGNGQVTGIQTYLSSDGTTLSKPAGGFSVKPPPWWLGKQDSMERYWYYNPKDFPKVDLSPTPYLIVKVSTTATERNTANNTKSVPIPPPGWIGNVTSVITAGIPGSYQRLQLGRRTTAVDLTVQADTDRVLESITFALSTLIGLDIPPTSVGARVYETASQTLIASNDIVVPGATNTSQLNVLVPISASLARQASYRIGVYVETGGLQGDGLSTSTPYEDLFGVFRINGGYAIGSWLSLGDSFPTESSSVRDIVKCCGRS